MTLFVLYDERGFNNNDDRFFKNIGQEEAIRARNIEMYMSVLEGSGSGVPILYFGSSEHEKIFFDKIVKRNTAIAFTTLPKNSLKYFHNKFFQDSSNVYKIKCIVSTDQDGDKEGMGTTPYRWIKFIREVELPAAIYPNSKTQITVSEEEKSNPQIFKTYFNPILLSSDESLLNAFYNFNQKSCLPLALPPSKKSENNTYFGDYTINGRVSGSIPEIRKMVRDKILSYEGCRGDCLFVKLWQLTDNPSFTEYLKDGSYFSLYATALNTNKKEPQESDGFPSVSFHYAAEELYNGDTLKKWKGELLEPSVDDINDLNVIKEAIYNDLTSGLPGFNTEVVRATKKLKKGWDTVRTDSFDTTTARDKEGWWSKIDAFKSGFNTENEKKVSEFIDELILSPSEARGRYSHDHNLALQLFSGYLCKFPFEEVWTDAANGNYFTEPDFESEWQLFCLDFILSRGNISPTTIDESIVVEPGKCTYAASLSPQQLFRLRLMLPEDTEVKGTFSSIINLNVLNESFVL